MDYGYGTKAAKCAVLYFSVYEYLCDIHLTQYIKSK